MSALSRGWDRLWFSTFDTASVALFRICVGTLNVVFYILIYSNWERFYGAGGLNGLHYHDLGWSVLGFTAGMVPCRVFWVVALVAALCFTVGWGTRAAAISLYVIQSSMIHSAPQVTNGEDLVFRVLLFYCCFAPLDRVWSLRAFLDARRKLPPRPPARIWPVRMMQIAIASVYLISVPNKLLDDVAWRDGTAIYLTMAGNQWTRWPWPQMFYGPLSTLCTYGTLIVEGSFPVLVWLPRTRPYVLIAIASLHVAIAIVLANVTFFTLAMACSFWLFIPGESSRRFVEAARARFRSRRIAAAGIRGTGSSP